jgi:hypothetical protein
MRVTERVPKPEIPREAVESSNIVSLGYDSGTAQLAVEFKSGHVYHYNGVPLDLALSLGIAESKGRFYAAHVRGKFTSELMTGICPACHDIGWVDVLCVDCGTRVYAEIDRGHRNHEEDNRAATTRRNGTVVDFPRQD